LTSGDTLLIVPNMNHLAAEMARRNGLITFRQACEKYDTTKDKLRDLISAGLLTCQTSDLDRRAKLLSIGELDGLLGDKQESNNEHTDRKVA
jgi:PhoPQ-activated pathogenicity-related protein